MIYLVIFIFFLYLVIRCDLNQKKRGTEAFLVFEAIVLILLFGLRYRLGADSLNYEEEWTSMPKLEDLFEPATWLFLQYQPLYYFFVAIVKTVADSFIFFQFVHAIIVNTIIFYFITRYAEHKFTAVLFYFVFESLNYNTEILRESLSICFFLLSFKYLLNRQWVKYYSFSFIAVGFHISALICFVLPFFTPILMKQWKAQKLILVITGFVLFSMIFQDIMSPILSMAIFSQTNQDKFIGYADGVNYRTFGFYIFYVWRCSLYLFAALLMRSVCLNSKVNNFSINIMFVFALAQLILPTVAGRWSGYFAIIYYISMAEMFYYAKNYNTRMVSIVKFYIALLFFLNLNSFRQEDSWNINKEKVAVRYFPYTSVFSMEKIPERESLIR